ncbi:class I adenylate-forming enzyme family protein [Blastococcus xanthinilyticus]|uniref:class I adenylate-forming enzyme family protein n=1 Tax=Blastococcus xanthinilyticus TaxID=1564164 RepID=UPI001FB59F4E|nr:class I adenylate-forming enzyme family protein [Blastococcus xanthinilyticus]
MGDVLRRAARLGGGDPLLRVPGPAGDAVWTAAELLADAERVATGLLARHAPGTRIATCLANGPEAVLLQLGVALAGMVLVPVNPRSSAPELEHALALSGAASVHAAVEVAGSQVAETAAAVARRLPHEVLVHPCAGDWRALLAGGGDRPSGLPDVDPGSLAQIQFTSGTTGRAKGVRITHSGMVATSAAFVARIGLPSGGVWIDPMPLFHTAGNVLGVMGALWQRAEHVVVAFEPARVLALVAQRHATLLSAAPTLLDLLMDRPEIGTSDLSSLRVVFTGGQTVRPSFVDRVEQTFGAPLITTFGMTETCGSALLPSPGDPAEVRRTTVGRPLAGTDVRIAGPDGDPVAPGEPGELWLRGPRLTPGYHDDPAATAAAIDPEGWLHTGDLAVMDPTGACRMVGRLKDMIKTGGENVSPEEVEEVLAGHPSVARAAVVGAPSERWGELVVAFVVPAAQPGIDAAGIDPAQLEQHCRSRLSPFKVPRSWRVVDQLPMTASTKIQRAELRRMAAADPAPASGRPS